MRLACYFLLIPLLSYAQQPGTAFNQPPPLSLTLSSSSALSIGDIVPDVPLPRMINYKSSSARLSDFKGKLLILDFWASWCTSCLRSFPKLDSLQRQFNSQLQVLLVNVKSTGDTEQKVAGFFEKRRNPTGDKFALPSVLYDTVLSPLFPHKLIPHYVWIKDSRVVAITDAESITAENIRAALNGSMPALPLKKDITDYNHRLPLLQDGNGGSAESTLYRSVLTRRLDGLGSGTRHYSDTKARKTTFINQPVLAMYQAALGFSANRVVLEVSDSSRFWKAGANSDSWKDHQYAYELSTPLACSEEERKAIIVQDLNRYLGLHGRMEKRTLPCWVLVQYHTTQTGRAKKHPFNKLSANPSFVLKNQPLSTLINALNSGLISRPPGPIVLDESGCTGPVTLTLRSPLNNLPSLGKELQAYGFDLIPAMRELEVFVLTDNQRNN